MTSISLILDLFHLLHEAEKNKTIIFFSWTSPPHPRRFALMAFTRRRYRRSRRRRTGRGKRYRRSSGGLTSRLARYRVMSHKPFGRSAGSLAPRKMYTKLENVLYVQRATASVNAAMTTMATCFYIGIPWAVWYPGTNNLFNAGTVTRSTITDNYPLGWQNYYGLYKQFVITGVKYHIQIMQPDVTPDTATAKTAPVWMATILPVPQDPDATSGSLYPGSVAAAQTAPNARTALLKAPIQGNTPSVSFKGYIPLSVLQGQEIYDDRFYQNTQPAGAAQNLATSAALSGMGVYLQEPDQYATTNLRSIHYPMIRASFRWYITFFDVRMFNVVS